LQGYDLVSGGFFVWILEYRELIHILTISNLRIKYQSSVLGFAWSLLNPLLLMLVLYFVYSHLFVTQTKNFAIFLLIGIITFRVWSNGTSSALSSIVEQSSLVTKIYIPRQIIVFSVALSGLISSLLEFVVLFAFTLCFGIIPTASIVLFPIILALYFLVVYGMGLPLAALYVYYRDLNQIWGVIVQLAFFLCPVMYSLTIIPAQYLPYYMLNPITIVMVSFRDIFLYGTFPDLSSILILCVLTLCILIIGALIFYRLERRFAEEL